MGRAIIQSIIIRRAAFSEGRKEGSGGGGGGGGGGLGNEWGEWRYIGLLG